MTLIGAASRADVDEHYAALRAMIEPLRKATKRVLLLSDIRQAEHAPPELEVHILGQMRQTFQPGDRVVMLTSDDDKHYVRELLTGVTVAAFSSQLAAEMWLMTEELPKIA